MPTAEGTLRTSKLTPEFKHYVDHRSTGSDTTAILWLLESFVRGPNYINVNEGDAVCLIADCIDTEPKDMVLNLIRTT